MHDVFFYLGAAFAFGSGIVIGRKWRRVAGELLLHLKEDLAEAGLRFPSDSERFLHSRMLWQPQLLLTEVDSPRATEIIERHLDIRKQRLKPFKWAFAGCAAVTCALWFTQVFVDVYLKNA